MMGLTTWKFESRNLKSLSEEEWKWSTAVVDDEYLENLLDEGTVGSWKWETEAEGDEEPEVDKGSLEL